MYTFKPEKFGFLPPDQQPKKLVGVVQKNAYVKVTSCGNAGNREGTFWYTACYQQGSQPEDRWTILNGICVPDAKQTSEIVYSGHITGKKFAKSLLKHLLGSSLKKDSVSLENTPKGHRFQASVKKLMKIREHLEAMAKAVRGVDDTTALYMPDVKRLIKDAENVFGLLTDIRERLVSLAFGGAIAGAEAEDFCQVVSNMLGVEVSEEGQ